MLTHQRSSSDRSPPGDSAGTGALESGLGKKKHGGSTGGTPSPIVLFSSFHSHDAPQSQDSHSKKEKVCPKPREGQEASTNKSLLSSFTRPLLASTPIGGGGTPGGIFHHKRRSSTGVERKTGGDSDRRFPRWSVSPDTSSENHGGIFHRFRANSKHAKPDPPAKSSKATNPAEMDSSSPSHSLQPLEEDGAVERNVSCLELPGMSSNDDPGTLVSQQPPAIDLDDRDLRSMETSLLGLLEDFQSGKLKAFAGDRAMEKMRRVREQQEMLAKLHFQLYEEESKLGTMTEDSSILTERNLKLLGKGLQDLSDSVQNLGWEDGINLNRKI